MIKEKESNNLLGKFYEFIMENGELEFSRKEFEWSSETVIVTKEEFLKVMEA